MKKVLMTAGLFALIAITQQSTAQGKSEGNKKPSHSYSQNHSTVQNHENRDRDDRDGEIEHRKTTTYRSHNANYPTRKSKVVRHDNGLHKGWYKGKHKGWYKNGKRVG